jgi:hypothetical protein
MATEDWRKEWTRYKSDNWARRLIDYTATFINNKKYIDHHTMQLLTEHGIFNNYKIRLNKENTNQCCDCKEETNDTEHSFFKYPRRTTQRSAPENVANKSINTGNIIKLVTVDDNI